MIFFDLQINSSCFQKTAYTVYMWCLAFLPMLYFVVRSILDLYKDGHAFIKCTRVGNERRDEEQIEMNTIANV